MDEILVLGPGTFPPQRQNIRLLYGTPENRRDVVYRRRHGRQTRGPYTDHGPIVEYGTEAIDAFVLEDAGELYISWKAYGLDPRPIELLACKISDDGLRMAGEPFTLLRDDKRQGMEGQHWLKIGDYYYIVYSINGCCGPGSDYAVAVARSKTCGALRALRREPDPARRRRCPVHRARHRHDDARREDVLPLPRLSGR